MRGWLVMAAVLVCVPAKAQTKAWNTNEIRQGGKLTGCELIFWHTGDDHGSGRPEPVMLKGEFDIIAPADPRRAAWVLQLSPNDATMVAGKLAFKLFTPIKAYFMLDDGSSSAGTEISSEQCELGGLCVLGQKNLVELMTNITLNTQIRVFYQRSRQSIDSEFVITMPSMDSEERKLITRFGDCVNTLLLNPHH